MHSTVESNIYYLVLMIMTSKKNQTSHSNILIWSTKFIYLFINMHNFLILQVLIPWEQDLRLIELERNVTYFLII